MLRPMSPSPPSGMTRSAPPARGGGFRRFPAADTAARLPSATVAGSPHHDGGPPVTGSRTSGEERDEVRGYLLGGSGNHGLLPQSCWVDPRTA
jgi:hypothetical protein